MNLTTKLVFGVMATGVNDRDLADGTDPINVTCVLDWQTGTGANQANQSFRDSGSLAATLTQNFNLAGSVLTDAFGAAISMARVKALYVRNTGTTNLTVGGTNGIVGSGFTLRPGEVAMKAAPDETAYATSGATTISVTNTSGSTTGTFDIIILGATA